eukprot:6151875-Amphidinium_carterae.2
MDNEKVRKFASSQDPMIGSSSITPCTLFEAYTGAEAAPAEAGWLVVSCAQLGSSSSSRWVANGLLGIGNRAFMVGGTALGLVCTGVEIVRCVKTPPTGVTGLVGGASGGDLAQYAQRR